LGKKSGPQRRRKAKPKAGRWFARCGQVLPVPGQDILRCSSEIVSGPAAQHRVVADDMVIYRFVQPLFEFAAIIIVLVPSNSCFQRFQTFHGQENCPVVRYQKDTMHAKSGSRKVDNRYLLLACSLFTNFRRDTDRVSPEFTRMIVSLFLAHRDLLTLEQRLP